jgi:exodeoxyribonuclease V alpha subunit
MEPDREPVFNGDLGTIVDIYKGELSVEFGDRVIGARGEEVFDLQLAYALTVHKSQGSEYPCVILPVYPTNSRMLQRNLLYTGLTRAKLACYLVGKKKAIQMAVDNDHIQKRFTTLKERLIEPTEWDVSLPTLSEDEFTDDF